MTKVTLPNGTWGKVTYYDDGRVKSVTIDPAGEEPEKTTYLYYSQEPRRTEVDPPDAPYVTYDIGDDGSVLKWWNAAEPPPFELAGTLYDNKGENGVAEPLTAEAAHWLEVQANDPEGIASIEVIADGDTLVHEKPATRIPKNPDPSASMKSPNG